MTWLGASTAVLQRPQAYTPHLMLLDACRCVCVYLCVGCDSVKVLGNQVKREVNKLYRMLEIDIDGVYKMMLLLKKKKYAALAVKEDSNGKVIGFEAEKKGLDLVRRDWCVLSRDVGNKVLDVILSGEPCEEVVEKVHTIMRKVAENVRNGKVGLGSFVITKGMNKAPRDYPNASGLPHVQVALRLQKMGKHVNVGDHIPFVVCEAEAPSPPASSPDRSGGVTVTEVKPEVKAEQKTEVKGEAKAEAAGTTTSTAAEAASGGSGSGSSPQASSPAATASVATPTAAATPATVGSAMTPVTPARHQKTGAKQGFAMRARHPTEIAKSAGRLKVDREWYLAQQLLPPIARLCEPIEGTSQAQLAACLGLDSSRFHKTYMNADGEEDDDFAIKALVPPAERYKDAVKFPVQCLTCGNRTCVVVCTACAAQCVCARLACFADVCMVRCALSRTFPGMFNYTPSGGECGIRCSVKGCDGLLAADTGADGKPTAAPATVEDALDMSTSSLTNQLMLEARKHVLEHMDGCVFLLR